MFVSSLRATIWLVDLIFVGQIAET